MKHVARFYRLLCWMADAACTGDAEALELLSCEAYSETEHIRNLSPDDRWKAACNTFRLSLRKVPGAELVGIGRAMFDALPTDVVIEPLDYEPTEVVVLS